MKRVQWAMVVVVACVCGLGMQRAGRAEVGVTVGTARVGVAVVGDAGFRLSVAYGEGTRGRESLFLAPGLKEAAGERVAEGRWVGVKSARGALLVDAQAGVWTLRDGEGRTVIPPAAIGERVTEGEAKGEAGVMMHVGVAAGKAFAVYGCGDGADSLLQTGAVARVGNGHAVVPWYWSDAGYGVLAVSGDDREPASWGMSADGGNVMWKFRGETGALYLMPAGTMREGCGALARLTGMSPVPPRWALGYLQSRWGWKDRAYIEETLKEFQTRRLPVDAFIFDFEWYTTKPDYEVPAEGAAGFVDFDFNPALFPEPAKQIAAMHAAGVHMVGIRKPRLGNSDALAMARSKGWILPPGGSKIDTRCLDYSKPEVRSWYAQQMEGLLRAGVDGWWNDEGELTYTLYPWWSEAEREALEHVRPGARQWSINRAFSPGLQRWGAAAWTGDIHATWEDLRKTPTWLLNWAVAGMPYEGCDIGGFSGTPSPELLTRWMEAGVFFPVMRAHSTRDVTPHFPWLFGTEAEGAMREALELRYRLVPYYYSLAHETHETGVPMMRPVAMEFPGDGKCANLSDEWMMGDGVLAAPVLTEGEKRTVYLPAGARWYGLNGGEAMEGGQALEATAKLNEIPVYVPAGTVLPLGPVVQHTNDLPGGPLEVRVYPGKDGAFTLVEDDGGTTGYLKGAERRTIFAWNEGTRTLSWKVAGSYAGKDVFTEMRVRVMESAGVRETSALLGREGNVVVGR